MRTTPKIMIASLAIVAGALFLTAGPAGAQDDGSGAYVENTSVTNNPPVAPEVQAANVTRESSLAFTGGDVAGLALIGGFAVALGGLLIVSRRRAAATIA